jgi:hypothetical protein
MTGQSRLVLVFREQFVHPNKGAHMAMAQPPGNPGPKEPPMETVETHEKEVARQKKQTEELEKEIEKQAPDIDKEFDKEFDKKK